MPISLPPDALPSVRLAGPTEADKVPEQLLLHKRVPSWDTATRKLTRLVEYLETEDDAHRAISYDIFTAAWASAAWQELYRVDYQACDWAVQTALIVFTGSYYFDSDGNSPIPPVTFFSRLQTSKEARQKALSRALSDVDRWQSIRVIGSGPRGYPMLYLGLYLSELIRTQSLQPVIDAHVNNCPIAGSDAHQLKETVTLAGNGNPDYPSAPSQLVHGLGKTVPGLASKEGITAESGQRRGTAAVLHGGQWRPYRFGPSI